MQTTDAWNAGLKTTLEYHIDATTTRRLNQSITDQSKHTYAERHLSRTNQRRT